MDAVDQELGVAEGPYFLSDVSLVDCTFAPFLERIAGGGGGGARGSCCRFGGWKCAVAGTWVL